MAGDVTELEARSIPNPGEKARLLTLDALDGRTSAVKRDRSFELQMAADLGDDLTAGTGWPRIRSRTQVGPQASELIMLCSPPAD